MYVCAYVCLYVCISACGCVYVFACMQVCRRTSMCVLLSEFVISTCLLGKEELVLLPKNGYLSFSLLLPFFFFLTFSFKRSTQHLYSRLCFFLDTPSTIWLSWKCASVRHCISVVTQQGAPTLTIEEWTYPLKDGSRSQGTKLTEGKLHEHEGEPHQHQHQDEGEQKGTCTVTFDNNVSGNLTTSFNKRTEENLPVQELFNSFLLQPAGKDSKGEQWSPDLASITSREGRQRG